MTRSLSDGFPLTENSRARKTSDKLPFERPPGRSSLASCALARCPRSLCLLKVLSDRKLPVSSSVVADNRRKLPVSRSEKADNRRKLSVTNSERADNRRKLSVTQVRGV